MKKRRVNVSRVFALIALVVSVISLVIGGIGLYQVHSLKSKENYTVQKIAKGDYVYFNGTALVMCVDVTITNKGYNNLTLDNITYTDKVFYADVVLDKTVYSYDTSLVQFNVGRQLNDDQVEYFKNKYGADQSIPVADVFEYIINGNLDHAKENEEKYKRQYEISFNTKEGSNYSNKVE